VHLIGFHYKKTVGSVISGFYCSITVWPLKTEPTACPRVSVIHYQSMLLNPLNAKLNPICHLLASLGAHHILHVSRVRVNITKEQRSLLQFDLSMLYKTKANTSLYNSL